MKNDQVYVLHIKDAILRIEAYTKAVDKRKFIKNNMIQDAVIRQLEIIGEAVKNLSSEFRKKYRNVPWKDIAGTRDKLIHDYIGVDISAVWATVKSDIPTLKQDIENILDLE